MGDLILAIDQGTTGTTVVVIDRELRVLAKCNREFRQIYPKAGWVEHDPEDIWTSTVETIGEALEAGGIEAGRIAAIGITNQRETTVVWERNSGRPVHNAIVWQCRRTADLCQEMKAQGLEEEIREKTGLLLDPYFSGTKLRWILDHANGLRERPGELAFGTIDTFLVWRLTGGKAHVTDVTNASRTMLMNLHTLSWDETLLGLLDIPAELLPEIRGNAEVYGVTEGVPGLPDGIPISGMAGDQQAALFGQSCFSEGEAKCTYGTGSFMLMNTGTVPIPSKNRLITTVAWRLGEEPAYYALEGSCFIAGAAVQWLRDGLKIIATSAEVEDLAEQVPHSGGVVFVPALVGLGAPHWRSDARGLICGINRGTTSAHIARATLEGIALQQYDLLKAMESDSGKAIPVLKVDGGASANNLLMQFQADILGIDIVRPEVIETTALGAAFLAGYGVRLWKDLGEIRSTWKEARRFHPQMPPDEVTAHLERWRAALSRA
ncbi:MAG: glycerol kinase [Deltaproteobacteria bacterium]|nr:MAG: glycerol kinase [Deltaproteobacteria bacterium]